MKNNEDIRAVIERRRTQNFVFFAMPVDKLYGNLFMDYEGISFSLGLKDSATYNEFITSLKSYRLNSKNYALMFITKAKVMVDILHNIASKFETKLINTYKHYDDLASLIPQDQSADYKFYLSELRKFKDFKLEELQVIKTLLLGGQDSKENQYLKMIEKEVQIYLNAMSKMIRGLSESPKYVASFATLESNCFVLEFHMVVLFEAFRRWLVKAIIARVYQHFQAFKEVAKLCEDFAKKQGLSKCLDFSSNDPISSMIDKTYKRFIKKKINLQPKFIISDQVLLEFFQEGYPINYNSSTFFCKKHYLCVGQDKDIKNLPVIMVIDVGFAH